MKSIDSNFIDKEQINSLYGLYINKDYNTVTDSFEEDINHSKGWSYVCLNETINYYVQQNIENE